MALHPFFISINIGVTVISSLSLLRILGSISSGDQKTKFFLTNRRWFSCFSRLGHSHCCSNCCARGQQKWNINWLSEPSLTDLFFDYLRIHQPAQRRRQQLARLPPQPVCWAERVQLIVSTEHFLLRSIDLSFFLVQEQQQQVSEKRYSSSLTFNFLMPSSCFNNEHNDISNNNDY